MIAPETAAALRSVRESGCRVVLVTGRRADDLRAVCSDLDVFDTVVAENGAVLLDPRSDRGEDLAAPPPPAFLARLRARGVPAVAGRVIVATVRPHETAVGEVIRELGLDLEIIFNIEAVMVLPRGISKGGGLAAALARIGVPARDTVGVGDGENDLDFLERIGLAAAVANAVPEVAGAADFVSSAPNGAGVREVARALLAGELDGRRRNRNP